MSKHKMQVTAEPGKQEIVLTRVFDAPRERVFKALTDPKAIPQWWGPRRLTTTVDQMDVRAGGRWRYSQRDAQKNEYAFQGVYHSVHAPTRIISTFEFEGVPGHVSLETMTLEEQGGQTTLTSRSVYQSIEDRDAVLASGMAQGSSESYDRFEEFMEKQSAKV